MVVDIMSFCRFRGPMGSGQLSIDICVYVTMYVSVCA